MVNRLIKIAFLSAILVVSKEIISFIPNVELVTLLFIVYTYCIGIKDSLYVSFIFTLVQSLLYPPSLWIVTYLIIWPILIAITEVLKRRDVSVLTLAIMASLFGLSFGAIDSFILMLFYGMSSFYPIWLRGLPWDITHAISNYLVVLLLFKPVFNTMDKLIHKK